MEESRYKKFLKQVGNKIRQTRLAKGLTMVQLANEANIEFRQLGRIERGEINTSLVSLLKLADALEVDPAIFLIAGNDD